jgi:pantoate--beta-alanine ligase
VLLETISDFIEFKNKKRPKSIGLVPTMGALHQGHLSLINRAKRDCECVVVSIFVNPTQFNNPNDLIKYPRTLDKDLKAIKKIGTDILVYVPSVEEIYPDGLQSKSFNFGSLSTFMEGEFRQGHFDGVGTVLQRLFNLIKPQKAYFGEKDYQQLAVVRKLVSLTGQPVEIVGSETYRENNGLAKSSRNKLLTAEDKQKAGIIYEQLKIAKEYFTSKPIVEIKKVVEKNFESLENFKLEYVEVAAVNDLIPTEKIRPDVKYRVFISVYCNDVRLIDNIALN